MKPVATLILFSALLLGCVSAEPQREAPKPPPTTAQAETIFLSARLPEDSDANGYLDTVEVTIYLFSGQYPASSLVVPGAFEFALTPRGGQPLAQWTIPKEAAQQSLRRFAPGPGYVFELTMPAGSDVHDGQEAELTCRFVPESGRPIQARATTLRVGRITRR